LEEDLATDLLVLQSHLDGMIDLVRKNGVILRRCQDFEMRLLTLTSLSDIIDHVVEDAKNYFDLDVVGLCLVDEVSEIEKLLSDEGFDGKLKQGLMLFQNKEPLQSIFGYAVRPYIGPYKNNEFANFFPGEERPPASVAITPLNRRGKYIGSLNLGSYQTDRFSSSMAMDFVVHLSSVVSVCLENSLNFETIKRTSYVDTLTGVNNRRFFEQRIVEELDRCQRNFDPLSCLFLDIDFFKSINDVHGHQAGDLVLSLTAKAIKTQLRNNDVLARYGGEEFVALLSNIDKAKAFEIAERIRKTVEALIIKFNDTQLSVTISIGQSTHIPDRTALTKADDVASQLIKCADTALYRAKHNGRNRVESYDSSLAPQLPDSVAEN
jgi:diguanylate cyclase (GGDEF)-like protein